MYIYIYIYVYNNSHNHNHDNGYNHSDYHIDMNNNLNHLAGHTGGRERRGGCRTYPDGREAEMLGGQGGWESREDGGMQAGRQAGTEQKARGRARQEGGIATHAMRKAHAWAGGRELSTQVGQPSTRQAN